MQIHSRKMNVSPDVNFDELARCTDDYNGAMLKAVCVEAVRGNLTCVPVSLPLYITGKGWSEYPVVYSWVSYFTKVREELFQLFVNKQLELILVPFATFFLVAIFFKLGFVLFILFRVWSPCAVKPQRWFTRTTWTVSWRWMRRRKQTWCTTLKDLFWICSFWKWNSPNHSRQQRRTPSPSPHHLFLYKLELRIE